MTNAKSKTDRRQTLRPGKRGGQRHPDSPAKAAGKRVSGGNLPSGTPRVQAVLLTGFMGAGKTSVGEALARQLGWTFQDLDARVEHNARKTVAEIFRASGESDFRRKEHVALKEVLLELRTGSGGIVALGGGTLVQKKNAALIDAAAFPTVFLDAGVTELWRRCRRQSNALERPLLRNPESFRKLYRQRRPQYLRASLRQQTAGKTTENIAAELIQSLGLRPGRPRGETKRGETK